MKVIIIIVILLLIIYILCLNKSNKTNKSNLLNNTSDYEDFEIDKILNTESNNKRSGVNTVYDDLEKMIESELSKKYDEQIDITLAKPSLSYDQINSNIHNISSKINNNIGNKTIWETYDMLVDDNSKTIKKFDKLEENYSKVNNPILQYGVEKGSLYFDNY